MKLNVYLPDDAYERKDFKDFVKEAVKERVKDSLFDTKILPDDVAFEVNVKVTLKRQ